MMRLSESDHAILLEHEGDARKALADAHNPAECGCEGDADWCPFNGYTPEPYIDRHQFKACKEGRHGSCLKVYYHGTAPDGFLMECTCDCHPSDDAYVAEIATREQDNEQASWRANGSLPPFD